MYLPKYIFAKCTPLLSFASLLFSWVRSISGNACFFEESYFLKYPEFWSEVNKIWWIIRVTKRLLRYVCCKSLVWFRNYHANRISVFETCCVQIKSEFMWFTWFIHWRRNRVNSGDMLRQKETKRWKRRIRKKRRRCPQDVIKIIIERYVREVIWA